MIKETVSIKTKNIRGLKIANTTLAEVSAWARGVLGNTGPADSPEPAKRSFAVFTPNAEIAQLCIEDPACAEIIASADLLLPDGAGVTLASRIIGNPLGGRVTGIDFGEEVLRIAAETGLRVFFLGGKPGADGEPATAELAAARMTEKYPGLNICGTQHGYFDKNSVENDAVIDKINAAEAEVVFVCFGAPAQERWICSNRGRFTAARLLLGLGGSIDIYAGTLSPTPAVFKRLGLEWLHRLIRQPSRFFRMLKLPKYIFGSVVHRIRYGKAKIN